MPAYVKTFSPSFQVFLFPPMDNARIFVYNSRQSRGERMGWEKNIGKQNELHQYGASVHKNERPRVRRDIAENFRYDRQQAGFGDGRPIG
jgi:hypothetical protein